MKAIIPVAGAGVRLRPHTHILPKVLIQVAGKPILAHILDELIANGIRDYVFIVGDKSEMVIEYVNTSFSINSTFVTQQERLGLGHAIWHAAPYFASEPVLIILGDTIFRTDLTSFLGKPANLLGVKTVDDPKRFGIAEIDQNRQVLRLVEKPENPASNLALVGLYYINDSDALKDALQAIIDNDIRSQGEYQLTDALQLMLDGGTTMFTLPVEGWYDCGKRETLLATNQALLKERNASYHKADLLTENVIIPPVYIHDTAEVRNCVIGPHVSIARGAKMLNDIVRESIINQNAHVENMIIEYSLIGIDTKIIGHFSQLNIGDSSEIIIKSMD